MKFYSRRTAAVVLAVALAIPTAASAQPQERDHTRRQQQIANVTSFIKKIQKLFGVSTNDDIPIPPVPTPPPPPPTNPQP